MLYIFNYCARVDYKDASYDLRRTRGPRVPDEGGGGDTQTHTH